MIAVNTDYYKLRNMHFRNYLRHGGYVFAGFCLSVCLFVSLCVSKITQKVMDGSFSNFEGMLGMT